MEAILTPIEYLLWALNPLGAAAGIVLFGLLVSGLAGRILPRVEVTGSGRRTVPGDQPLATLPERERISR